MEVHDFEKKIKISQIVFSRIWKTYFRI